MKTIVVAENCINVDPKVGERLEKHKMSVQLTKRKHVKDVLSQSELDRLAKEYNIDNMYLEFAILTFGE